ncbi:MAG: tetratricopeptide repeat protein [Paracoccaceae bacterium]
MANPDSFIQEVDDELKRDKLFAFIRKYGWIAVTAVVVLVGATAFNEWRKAQATAAAQAFGDAVITALDSEDPAERATALAAVQADGERAGILRLLQAATSQDAGDVPAALEALAAVENDSTLPTSYRQIAALKRVILGGATIPAEERDTVLRGLATPGQAFRPLALEQLVLLKMEQGEIGAALAQAQAILQEPDLTDALRERIQQTIILLGGAPLQQG